MVQRLQKLATEQSLFLFGARGTGKSTLLKNLFPAEDALWIDLLDSRQEDLFFRNPERLSFIVAGESPKRIIIDEIQKIPKLLDIIHMEMEKNKSIQWIMTGSSARKLKRGRANLLAGRAVVFYLYPFSCFETKDGFDLCGRLRFGGLPRLLSLKSDREKALFLKSYVQNYLKEEILQEQIIRNIRPFRNFLEIAAQMSGQIVNYSKCAREIGADYKTVQNYFSVLEDTLVGFFLPAYHRSIRKQQQTAPKFFLFDLGARKALEKTLSVPVKPGTFAFGQALEHFILAECRALNHYFEKDYRFSYLKTKDGREIDLIIQRPGEPDLLVEIKSTAEIRKEHIRTLQKIAADWKAPCESQVWSQDPQIQKINGVQCLPWQSAVRAAFLKKNRKN